jgi:Dolichyl-phosphate-mannose-protein mannosyltransferase
MHNKLTLKSFVQNWGIIAAASFIKLVIHLLTYTRYGTHRDEFMYFEMGNHLTWGFIETPPVIAIFAWLARHIFGYTEFAVRFFPAVFGALNIFITGMIVKRIGGKAFAQTIAMITLLIVPLYLRIDHYFMPVVFNYFFWILTSYFVISYLQSKNKMYILWTGVAIGLGMLTKHTMFLWAVSLLVSIALSKEREIFKTKQPWQAIGIAFLIFLPNLIWQWLHGFPVFHHMAALNESQLVHIPPAQFLIEQAINAMPVLLFWLGGLAYLLFRKDTKTYRPLGWAFLINFFVFMLLHGKSYYIGGSYFMLFAFGGLFAEQLIKKIWLKIALPAVTILLYIPVLPYSLPVLPLGGMIYYGQLAKEAGLGVLNRWEDGRVYDLPQDYADQLGWEELADIIAFSYNQFSEKEKLNCTIYGENYGEAGAVDFYGHKYNLPKAISMSSNYFPWLPQELKVYTVFWIGGSLSNVENFFEEVEIVGRITNPFARERGLTVYLCRGIKPALEEAWDKAIQNQGNN